MNLPSPAPSEETIEERSTFSPRFDGNGLITAVVTDAADGTLLMVAHMNAEALALTMSTRVAHFWSRSRSTLWKKGETSGNTLKVVELRTDCDQDVIWVAATVGGDGVTCHTGRRSCFYRIVDGPQPGQLRFADIPPGSR